MGEGFEYKGAAKGNVRGNGETYQAAGDQGSADCTWRQMAYQSTLSRGRDITVKLLINSPG